MEELVKCPTCGSTDLHIREVLAYYGTGYMDAFIADGGYEWTEDKEPKGDEKVPSVAVCFRCKCGEGIHHVYGTSIQTPGVPFEVMTHSGMDAEIEGRDPEPTQKVEW